ncbi:MAG: BadM/Rrf2 family transcriptional regulator [uncultured bacterium]|nr:MAG: BadM/Rrf2 family transcriptional regulator [uncultured bacterium]
MKITSRASDYALLLLIHLAALKGEETSSIKKISQSLNLSLRFLANIANKLGIARIIISHRGVGGGIRLARSAFEISIKEVIEAVDGPIQTMFCQNTHEACNHEMLCQMKHFWDNVQGTVMDKLTYTTIGNLLSSSGSGGECKTATNAFSNQEATLV